MSDPNIGWEHHGEHHTWCRSTGIPLKATDCDLCQAKVRIDAQRANLDDLIEHNARLDSLVWVPQAQRAHEGVPETWRDRLTTRVEFLEADRAGIREVADAIRNSRDYPKLLRELRGAALARFIHDNPWNTIEYINELKAAIDGAPDELMSPIPES